ncbi:MAG: CDP-alcohol phosphatidyltransferase family protein [Treponema sp.]|nr:CDP-alcohol phosphatidyltransferase family protein [Treponema sp.]
MKNNKEKKEYTYSFENNSFLDGILMKYVVPPVLNRLPMTLRPNNITMFSGLCALSAFMIMLQAAFNHFYVWWLIPILMFVYLVSDCLDGAQARRTKMFSALGEFLDHFFDSAVTGYLVGGILIVYREMNPVYFIMALVIGYFTQAASFWERYKTGKMFFGKFSSTETVCTLTAVIFVSCFEPIRNFMKTPLFWTISPIRLFLIVSCFFAFLNGVKSLIRSKSVTVKFFSYVLLSLLVALLLSFTGFNIETKVIFISLYIMIYLAKLLVSITMQQKDKYPDFGFPVILIGILLIGSRQYLCFALCMVYLVFSIMIIVFNSMFEYIHVKLRVVEKIKERRASKINEAQCSEDSETEDQN